MSGFTRRMLLQVLLEDEKVVVALRTSPDFYTRLNPNNPNTAANANGRGMSRRVDHPCFGAGRGCSSLSVNINSPCSEVLTWFGGTCCSVCLQFGRRREASFVVG